MGIVNPDSSTGPAHRGVRKGGAWLLEETAPADILTPERLSDEHRLIGRTTEEFVEQEVLPVLDRLERKEWDVARGLIRRCGDLGLLGVNVPEAYGGLDLDKTSSLVVAERVARSPSFAVMFGAQTNLCILPLVLFGTDDQKGRYLPGLISGERVGAYALSEVSQAPMPSPHGRVPCGRPMAAGASRREDVDHEWRLRRSVHRLCQRSDPSQPAPQFTAFIVERGYAGLTSGHEEHKMGLHASSTTPILLQDVRVPAGNVLGEVGKGHKSRSTP
jgi:alkylation response protein AidB-like acyl-CoA dehydrogenase